MRSEASTGGRPQARKKWPALPTLAMVVILVAALGAEAAERAARPSAAVFLDQKKIHASYSEGDFDAVIAAIDSFTHANKTYSVSDSVFIAKHLAVIYTANPATREKGKSYMFRLLNLLPSAKIVDMFVSDEIDRIFEKVREEYIVSQQSKGLDAPNRVESNQYAANRLSRDGRTAPNPESPPTAEKKSPAYAPHSTAVYWVAGGVVFMAVAGASYYLMQPKKPAPVVYDVPK